MRDAWGPFHLPVPSCFSRCRGWSGPLGLCLWSGAGPAEYLRVGPCLAMPRTRVQELGNGFVLLQMISLGGRMLNVVPWQLISMPIAICDVSLVGIHLAAPFAASVRWVIMGPWRASLPMLKIDPNSSGSLSLWEWPGQAFEYLFASTLAGVLTLCKQVYLLLSVLFCSNADGIPWCIYPTALGLDMCEPLIHDRMILAPFVLYYVAYAIDIHIFHVRGQTRPLAFWAPALIVAAMPTANNMHLGNVRGVVLKYPLTTENVEFCGRQLFFLSHWCCTHINHGPASRMSTKTLGYTGGVKSAPRRCVVMCAFLGVPWQISSAVGDPLQQPPLRFS